MPDQNRTEPIRVLIAEDSPVVRKIVIRMLEQLGCHATSASDGQEAVDAVEARPYDLVLMDCQMPTLDGFEATEAIRRRGDWAAGVPIVAMTASTAPEDRARCLAAGMDDVVAKPVAAADLRAAVERWTASARRSTP